MERDVSPNDILRIKHPKYILELFETFYHQSPVELQLKLLSNLEGIVLQARPYNGKLLCRDQELNLVQRLISLLPTTQNEAIFDRLLNLIFILSAHSMSIENVKHYFTTLYQISKLDNEFLSEKSKLISMLKALFNSVQKELSPLAMFDFDGLTVNSGIQLPQITSFPKSSYSIAVWFKAETFIDSSNAKYSPRLFSLFTPEGTGIEAFFETSRQKTTQLQIQTVQFSKGERLIIPFSFVAKKWYFLSFSHTYSLFTKSEVAVYIDGAEVYKGGLKYPSITEPLSLNYIFSSYNPNTSFFGQSTQFYFFKELINAKDIDKLYKLGINFALNHFTKKHFLSKETLFCYTPLASDTYNVYDVSAELFDKYQQKRFFNNASLLRGTDVIISKSIRESIYNAGGLDLFLPLFVFPFTKDNSNILREEYQTNIGKYHSIILDFLFYFTTISDLFKFEMVKRKGFHLIRYLLQKSSPFNLSLNLLDPIKKLERVIIPTSTKFKKLVFKDFFFQFSLWAMGDYEFQSEYLSFLSKLVISVPTILKKSVGVQSLLDILQTYYWYSEDPTQIIGKVQSKNSFQFKRSNLSYKNIFTLRRYFINMIGSIISSDGFTKQDCLSIIRFLFTSNDKKQIEDILSLVLMILLSNRQEVCLQFDDCGSVLPFFSLLLNAKSERILVLLLRIIGLMVNNASKKTKKIFNGKQGFSIIATTIQPIELTYSHFIALMEIAIDRVSTDYKKPKSNDIIAYNSVIKTPEFFDVLFSLLPLSNFELLQLILEDFIGFLRNNEHAKLIFISQPIFIKWIMTLFTQYIANDKSGEIQDLLMKLFSILFQFCLTQKDGWKHLELLIGFLHVSVHHNNNNNNNNNNNDNNNNSNPKENEAFDIYVQEIFIQKLVESMSSYISSLNIANSQVILQNLAYIACMIDDYIFSPYDIDIRNKNDIPIVLKRLNGKWRDFQLAQDLLTLLDSVLFSPYSETINNELLHSQKSRSIYILILRLILLCLRESYKIYENSSPKFSIDDEDEDEDGDIDSFEIINSESGHENVLDTTASRILPLIGKIAKTNNTFVTYVIWTIFYLIRSCSSHKMIYQSYNHSISKVVKELIISHRISIETFLKDQIPELSADSSNFGIEKFIQTIQEKCQLLFEFENIKNEIEQDLASLLTNVSERRMKRMDEFTSSISENCFIILGSSIDNQVEQIKQEYLYIEINRRVSWLIQQGESQQLIQEEWDHLYSNLSLSECYSWLVEANKGRKWKLDSSEDDLRRRWKMVLNFDASDYKEFTWKFIRERDSAVKLNAEKVQVNPLTLSSEFIQSIQNINQSQQELEEEEEVESFTETSTDFGDFVIVDKSTKFTISPFLSKALNEKTSMNTDCDLISPLTVISGKFRVTNKSIYFFHDPSSSSSVKKDYKWSLSMIKGIHRRRYLLRNTSLEIFFTDRKNIFIDFPKNIREKIIAAIIATNPSNLTDYTNIKSSTELLRSSNMTARWQKREISNFEYLMYLNTIAGRTYNDLSQYPVFPWILTDYESEKIDLNNLNIYRDLSKPVGALNQKRLNDFMARYEMSGDDTPKFFYGSHYSTALVVLYYLIRMEPFTSYYIQLQGRFDHADRLFSSVASAWNSAYNLSQDVKELIPEFFYSPTLFRNENNFDFGEKQNNEVINHIQLPPWAKGSPEEFVRINAEALESDYVSAHLHEWIDLIFGFKQKGEAAVEAKNLFYHLTYEGSVNIDKIEDPVLRRATIEQILSFGQCPSQLFVKAHPSRNSSLVPSNYFADVHFLSSLAAVDPKFNTNQLFVQFDRFFIVNNIMGFVAGYKINSSTVNNMNENQISLAEMTITQIQQTSSAFSFSIPPLLNHQNCFHIDIENKTIISFGHWDGSIRVIQLPSSTIMQTINLHKQPVTCFDITDDNSIIACGSADCLVSVWKLKKTGKTILIKDTVLFLLRGHQSPVQSVSISSNLDLIVSGGGDGNIVTHTLFSGAFVRLIHDDLKILNGGVDILKITPNANIVAYSKTSRNLVLYSINGRFLAQSQIPLTSVNSILIQKSGKYVITAGKEIHIFDSKSLELLHTYDRFPNDEIISAQFACDEKYIVFALKSSLLQICLFS